MRRASRFTARSKSTTPGLAAPRLGSAGAASSGGAARHSSWLAVEKRGRASGRTRMAVIPDFRATTINSFITQNVAPGSTIHTDGLKSFAGLQDIGFENIPRTQPLRHQLSKGKPSVVPLADRAIGNLQHWLTGPLHQASRAQLKPCP